MPEHSCMINLSIDLVETSISMAGVDGGGRFNRSCSSSHITIMAGV